MVDEPKRRGLRNLALDNVTTVVSALAAFILFTGNGYYDTLLVRFGLRPGMLALSQVEIASMGVYSTIYAIPAILIENWKYLAVGTAIPVMTFMLLLLTVRTAFGRLLQSFVVGTNSFSEKHPYVFLKIPTIIFFCAAGLLAGTKAGEYNARAYNHARVRSTTCYATKGKLYRGVVLAQDQNRTILLHADRVSLIKNDDLAFVSKCPATASETRPKPSRH